VRALGAIRWGVTAFDWRMAVKGPAWGASTGEIAHNAPSLPARDGPGAALRQRQRRQDLLRQRRQDLLQDLFCFSSFGWRSQT